MLGYHLVKARWMASHPSAHSDHKVLSAMGRSLVFRLIFNRIIKLGILLSIASKLCDRNERLDALPYSKPLSSGIYARFQLLQRA